MIDLIEEPGQKRGRPALALVLGAGGLRGIAHVGVLQALSDLGVLPEVVIGTSSGAIVGACHAVLGWEPGRMAEAAHEMGSLAGLAAFWGIGGVGGGGALGRIFEELQGRDFEPLQHGVRLFGVSCCDLVSRTEKFFHTGQPGARPLLRQAVLGSAALPLLCPTQRVTLDGTHMRLIDGGLSRTVPVELALDPPINARRALVVDLSVATGWNERGLDRQQRLQRRYGDRLMIIKPGVTGSGTVVMRRGESRRVLEAGRLSVSEAVARWLALTPHP